MSAVHLHTFVDHAHAAPTPAAENTAPMVTRSLADILPALALAQQMGMAWLQDFVDEPVQITEDLDEVLNAFRDFCMDD